MVVHEAIEVLASGGNAASSLVDAFTRSRRGSREEAVGGHVVMFAIDRIFERHAWRNVIEAVGGHVVMFAIDRIFERHAWRNVMDLAGLSRSGGERHAPSEVILAFGS
jgi:hypothetical protein